jgi:hypothetical protein
MLRSPDTIERVAMKPIQLIRFPAALCAAMVGMALTAPAANAFTFNDAAGDKTGDTSMFNDPVNRTKSGYGADSDKNGDKLPKSGFYFNSGRAQSFDERNNSERYFNPNTLLGR